MLSILLLGSPQLCLDQRSLPLPRRKSRALVYYLAAQPGPVRRERLLALLWPEHERPSAQHSLRTMLHGLRQALGPALIVTDEALALEPRTEVDARRFVAELTRSPSEPQRLQATLDLYRGDFLADFTLPDSPEFDNWVMAERERYRQLAVRGLTTLAQQHARRNEWPAALTTITRAIDLDPLREDVQATAMQLQYLSGDRTGAIRRYEQLRKLLDDELGLPPTVETQAVYDAIIKERLRPEAVVPVPAEPELPRPAAPPDVSPPVSAPQPQAVTPDLPILATKLYLPRPRTELVSRPRLLARLAGGLTRPLTLVAAPAGFGKTTVLADWLNHEKQRSQHVAWLGLDASDSDPTQFLRYLIAALQTVAPHVGARVLNLLRSSQTPSIELLMPLLVNDLVSLPEDSILVLDDYHVIETRAVHEALAYLLDHLPPQLHLVITTRVDPPLPLSRMRARGQLTELRAHDLRFTQEEAAAFLQETMGVPVSLEDVAVLEGRTEGWIAGLQLTALSLRDRSTEQRAQFIASFTGSNRFVVDYLVDEVLARQPAHLQRFLLQTSILDRLSGPLCDAVALSDTSAEDRVPVLRNQPYSQAVLEELERANLFIVPLDGERRWYRYHHLFAQVLCERLTSGTSTEAVAMLHRRASTWFEQQGHVEEAVQHALAAQDWERAIHLIEAHGLLSILGGRVHSVLNWMSILPETSVSERPYLFYLNALGFFFANQLEAAEHRLQVIDEALSQSILDERFRAILGYAAVTRAAIAFFRGYVADGVTLSRQAWEILPTTDVAARASATIQRACAFLVSGAVTLPNERELVTAVAAAREAGEVATYFNGSIILAGFQRRQGRLRQAAASYREAAHLVPEPHALPNSAPYYFGLGNVLREWNDLHAADDLLMQGQELVRSGMLAEADAVTQGYAAVAFLQQVRGEAKEARATLRELEMVARGRSFAPHLFELAAAAQAQLAVMQGDLAQATLWAESNSWCPDDELSYPHEPVYLALARVRIAQGSLEPARPYLRDALHLLEHLLKAAEAGQRVDSVIEILLLRALALQAQGDLPDALAALERALLLAAPEGYVHRFVDEGSPMSALLARGLGAQGWGFGTGTQEQVVRPYAHKLLQLFSDTRDQGIPPAGALVATPAPQVAPYAIQALSERELEVLQLVAAGRSNQAIAAELIVAVGTVKRHVSNIMGKLQAESRLEAVARARALGLI